MTSTPEKKLLRHVFNNHFSKKFVRFRCRLCSVSFKTPDILEKHLDPNLTSEQRKVSLCRSLLGPVDGTAICNYCGKEFRRYDVCNGSSSTSLGAHVYMHMHVRVGSPAAASALSPSKHPTSRKSIWI